MYLQIGDAYSIHSNTRNITLHNIRGVEGVKTKVEAMVFLIASCPCS